METPSWGNVVWFDQNVDEQWSILPLKTSNEDEEDPVECHTKIEHQSASKQYYEKYATNRIYKFEAEFQESTKHNSSTPKIEYETFKFLDDEDTINISKESNDERLHGNNCDEDELGNIFNISRNSDWTHIKNKGKEIRTRKKQKDRKFQNLKNLQ